MGLKVILLVDDSLFIGLSGFGVERSKDESALGFLIAADVLEVDLFNHSRVMQVKWASGKRVTSRSETCALLSRGVCRSPHLP